MTISVKVLKELLAFLPDEARVHGYEGEDSGITVNLPDDDFTWIRAREGALKRMISPNFTHGCTNTSQAISLDTW